MAFERLRKEIEGQVFTDEETLLELQQDFGRMKAGMPVAVVVPASGKDLSAVVKNACREGWTVTTRGSSHSQGGQSLSAGGILVDMSAMNRIERVGRHAAWVQAGALWSDVVREAVEQNLVPPVLTDYLDVTVGGTLSTGGIGAASFKLGNQAIHVEELDLVTGEGHEVRCSPDRNTALFNCARAGLGQFGIITRAKIQLRPCASHVRTFNLLYDNLPVLMRDLEIVMPEERFDYLQAQAVPCCLGYKSMAETRVQFAEWFFLLMASVEFGRSTPRDDALLDGLKFYRKVHVEDASRLAFDARHEALYSWWREMGAWNQIHPWVETTLPWEKAAPYVQGVLRSFPPNLLLGGLVVLLPLRTDGPDLPMLSFPPGEKSMHFGILPSVSRHLLPLVSPLLMKAGELSSEMGGKRRLSSWVNFDEHQWKAQFGDRWSDLVQWKRFYDPGCILNPGFIDFGGIMM